MREGVVPFPELARGRRSIRRFREGVALSAEQVRHLLEIATWAPSAHHRQPWRFVVVQTPAERHRLAQAMAERLRRERLADGDDPAAVEADVRRSTVRIEGAPHVVVLCLNRDELDRYPDPRRSEAERLMAVQSVAMAGQNLMLAAHNLGAGSSWVCAPLFAPQEVSQALGLPAAWEPQGAILLGMPEHIPAPRPRRPMEEVVRFVAPEVDA
jgi:F420 biosynthesis protein FbiB-like protein